MSITLAYLIECDRCGTVMTDPDGSPGYYGTIELAEAAAAKDGWATVAAVGRRGKAELCPACTPLGAPGGPIEHRPVDPPVRDLIQGAYGCACGAVWFPGKIRGVSERQRARCPRQAESP